MSELERPYQRTYLRAPYGHEVLYSDGGSIYKCKGVNISEKGLLIRQIPFFPEGVSVDFMLALPQFPLFKNYSLEKLKNYSQELFPSKVIRGKLTMARQFQDGEKSDSVFDTQVGCELSVTSNFDKEVISKYIETFTSNIVSLQVMIDLVNSDDEYLQRTRALAGILGYDSKIKISLLKKKIFHDYASMQWFS